jgi:hypothetical protein
MLGIRLAAVALLSIGLMAAPAAQAANQLYQGSWVAESFGNDLVGGTGASEFFSVFGMPQGILCNAGAPRCPLASTPVSAPGGNFSALGDTCTPYTVWNPSRPAKGATACTVTPMGGCQPFPQTPRYRNPAFFTAGGAANNATACTASTTVGGSPATMFLTTNSPDRGVAMKGNPVSGPGVANATAYGVGGAFTIAAAGANPKGPGMRRTTVGSFNNIGGVYLYSYTYATFRNASGFFASGFGPGDFSVPYKQGANTVAKAVVKKGPNQFGGVMRLLGKLTTKVCYFRNGGCSLGENDWRYDAVGTSAMTSGGVVTQGYQALYTAMYYHTALMQVSTIMAIGSRFPWTTGSVTVTATGRGPHKTVERRKGYDARTAGGGGTLQLVTPIITRWLQPAANFETGGVGVLRFEFAPEPAKWMALAAGLSLLTVVYRARGR